MGEAFTPKQHPNALSDAEFFGVPELAKHAQKLLEDRPDWYISWLNPDHRSADFVVYADAWPAVELFAGLQSQWRISVDAITGLDYTAVMAVLNLYACRKSLVQELFEAIQALEIGALTAYNELAEQRKADHKA